MDDLRKTIELVRKDENTFVAQEPAYVPQTVDCTNTEEDFAKARENLRKVVDISQSALEEISSIAGQSQDAEAYDVVAKTINSAIAANKALIEIVKQKADLDKVIAKETPQEVTNNLFVGSTAELSKMLEDLDKKKKKNDNI